MLKRQPQPVNINDLLNTQYRKKLIPTNIGYQKEELYDQNLALKVNINDYKDDNMRLRTRMKQLVGQLRGRDRLIDELYKSAYITANGNKARHNLNKDALILISLKREVETLKDQLFQKEDEVTGLKMSMKMTKIQELETELRMYVGECMRMRRMTETAVKMSGEIDLNRLTRRAREDSERY